MAGPVLSKYWKGRVVMRFWKLWALILLVLTLVSWNVAWGGGDYERGTILLNRFLFFVWISSFFSVLAVGKPTPEPV